MTQPDLLARFPELANCAWHGALPVPFFTLVVDGKPDFRLHDPERHNEAISGDLCGICGTKLKKRSKWFLLGPETFRERTPTFMPAMHEGCARASLELCPWLVMARPGKLRASIGLSSAPPLPMYLVECAAFTVLDHPESPGWLIAQPGLHKRVESFGEARVAC